MNKKETTFILGILQTEYPVSFQKINTMQMKDKIELWADVFQSDSVELVASAVKSLISKRVSSFSPVAGEIKREMLSLTTEIKSADEAWGDVQSAIARYGIYNQINAFESLDELTSNIVERIGFRNICLSENSGVERGQFMKMYDAQKERHIEKCLMPPDVKRIVDKLRNEVENGQIKRIANFEKDEWDKAETQREAIKEEQKALDEEWNRERKEVYGITD